MEHPRDRFIADTERYQEACRRLIAGFQSYVEVNDQALVDLRGGMSLSESFRVRDSAALSRRIAGLLEDFEAHRRQLRASAAAALQAEGRTVQEIGEAFGVSAQLAGRFAKEPPTREG